MQLTHQSFIDLATGKVEAGQIAIDREARDLELIGHRSNLPFCCLGFEQLGEDRDGGFERWRSLFHESGDGLCHAMHLEAAEHDDDGRAEGRRGGKEWVSTCRFVWGG